MSAGRGAGAAAPVRVPGAAAAAGPGLQERGAGDGAARTGGAVDDPQPADRALLPAGRPHTPDTVTADRHTEKYAPA